MQLNNNSNLQPAKGNLQVQVFATDVGKPANNVTVRITRTQNRQAIVEEMITNDSGKTPTVELSAPPIEYSLEPNGDRKPYSEYDVNITKEGYQPVDIEGVQILALTKALQNIRLDPIIQPDERVENFIIKPHTLWGNFPPKIEEEPVKPLPESLGLVVLPNPVVPEFIVVHDGVPSDSKAKNYWIPFKDYIKNVASCEIYSTWPRPTIEANILAIISFTLNRVYTEWYRGKGYNFTITNSTAYDQSFVLNRNIYENISEVVDYLFTTFITKPGIRQPLFAQYCDGERVRCPKWLEQWGSKSLGDQGLSSIDILKRYYGQDIFLLEATKVSGVPVSFPGSLIQTGSTGPNVRTIQEQLNAISNNFPAIPKIRVDGIFGPLTRNSVETFQNVFNLPSTGIVDFATWYKISNIFVSVERLSEL
ncbi:MAG TPA: peptidoglycan-binding domain-containing protein [Clostridia bacterium]|nr:peptidoglycan-binding domain-containing protein [Clostridia bacterium]